MLFKTGDRVKVQAHKTGAGRTGTVSEVKTLRSGRQMFRVDYDMMPGDHFTADSLKMFSQGWQDAKTWELMKENAS